MRTSLKKTGQEERVLGAQVEGLTSGSNPGKGRWMGVGRFVASVLLSRLCISQIQMVQLTAVSP